MNEDKTHSHIPYNDLTRDRTLGMNRIKHGHYAKIFLITLMLVVVILGSTGLAYAVGYHVGSSNQLSEDSSEIDKLQMELDKNTTKDTDSTTNTTDDAQGTVQTELELGLIWERKEVKTPDGTAVWNIELPTQFVPISATSSTEGTYGGTLTVGNDVYSINFFHPIFTDIAPVDDLNVWLNKTYTSGLPANITKESKSNYSIGIVPDDGTGKAVIYGFKEGMSGSFEATVAKSTVGGDNADLAKLIQRIYQGMTF